MTTVQIVGIAVAAAIVILLVIALLVTRRRGSAGEEPAAVVFPASFLDDAPQDTLSGLGKAEQPMEDITVDPGLQRQVQSADESSVPARSLTTPPEQREPDVLSLDWGSAGSVQAADTAAGAATCGKRSCAMCW